MTGHVGHSARASARAFFSQFAFVRLRPALHICLLLIAQGFFVVSPHAQAQTTTTLTSVSTTSTTLPGCLSDLDCPPGQSCINFGCEHDADNDGLTDVIDPCPLSPRNLCFGAVAIDRTTANPIRLNAIVSATAECAGTKTDCNGDVWMADFGWNMAGKAAKCGLDGGGENCIIGGLVDLFGCEDESTEDLFQCEHFDIAALPDLAYDFDVPDGEYLVNLFFANTAPSTPAPGDRVFDIYVEGQLEHDDFDQVAAANGNGVAVVRSVLTNVVDGNGLQLHFEHFIENPSVKAIEVLSSSVSSTSTTMVLPSTTLLPVTTTTLPACFDDLECHDGNDCTDDLCIAGLCEYADNSSACDDGLACTTGDVCSAGTCAGFEDCAPGEACDPTSGTCQRTRLWIAAGADPTASFQAAMTTGLEFTSGTDLDPTADNITSLLLYADSTVNAFGGGSPDKVTYTVQIPEEGTWYLWGRFYYPELASSSANSFFAQVDDGPLHKFGNNKGFQQAWHWDGDGMVESGPITPLSLGFVTAGAHQLTIEKREVLPTPPRLDVLFLTSDPLDTPSDAEAAAYFGVCIGDSDCDDGNVCTDDTCDAGGCSHADNTAACDDAVACTTGDTCSGGVCAGSDTCGPGAVCDLVTGLCESTACTGDVDCDDGVTCTLDICNVGAGLCSNIATDGLCDDGDVCTGIETCDVLGDCQPGIALDCDDLDPCTADSCDAAAGCLNAAMADGLTCDDGDACNGSDTCQAGTCVPGSPLACDDGLFCNGTETCDVALGCLPGAIPCGDDVPCTLDVCDEDVDTCGTFADDTACDDGNVCTDDTCDLVLGCVHATNTIPCNDGLACTTGDVCAIGVCSGFEDCPPGEGCDLPAGQCQRQGLWIPAATDATAIFLGAMTADATYAAGTDADPVADSLVHELVYADSPANSFSIGSGDKAVYTVTIPDDGNWFLWGRFYYPGAGANSANSFFAQVDAGPAFKFGNNKGFAQTWHWDGDGTIENGALAPISLGFLAAGPHQLMVEKREVVPTAPRLDVLFLTDDPLQVPTDAQAAAALGGCASDSHCDDDNPCTDDACVATACEQTANSATCDDGVACTAGDVCFEGACTGADICSPGFTCNLFTSTCEPAATTTTTIAPTTTLPPVTTTAPPVSTTVTTVTTTTAPTTTSMPTTTTTVPLGLWIPAATHPSAAFAGNMTVGTEYAGGTDADPAADNLISPLVYADSTTNAFAGGSGDEVDYLIDLPRSGNWFLWARMYYPNANPNAANSFYVKIGSGPLLKLGNNKDFAQTWHWDGDGTIESGAIAPLPLGYLTGGLHPVTVEKREVTPLAPRLDVVFLTDDPLVVPTDVMASAALGTCSSDAHCDDGDPCTDDACIGIACQHGNNNATCDDGVACTLGDVCIDGTCLGGDACPIGQICNPGTGACDLITTTTTAPTTTTTTISTTTTTLPVDLDNDGLFGGADPCPLDPRNLCYGPVAVDSGSGTPLRINANGSLTDGCAGARVDCNGDSWSGDFGFGTPSSSETCNLGGGGDLCVIAGVDTLFGCDDASTQDLFQCARFANTPAHPPLSYALDVVPGDYLVNVFFANTYTGTDGPGERMFDILVEGVTVHDDFDQVLEAPGSGTAVVRSTVVTVLDGTLDISFNAEIENATVKAIEVLAGTPLATTTTSTSTTTASVTTTVGPTTTTTLPLDSDNDGMVDASDPCPIDPRNLCYGPVAVETAGGVALRVNANGSIASCAGTRTDCNGDTWTGDFGFGTPSSSDTCNLGGGGDLCVIAGVDTLFGCDDASTQDLFQCARFASSAGHPPLNYSFEVAPGQYLLNLYFANTFIGTDGAGERVFDILCEGLSLYDDFDQVAAAPGSGTAVVRSAVVTVVDGALDLSFPATIENAAIKAIEVLAGPSLATTTTSTTTTTGSGATTTTVPVTTTTLPVDSDNDGMLDVADPCPADPRNLCYGPVAIDSVTTVPLRINTNSSGAACAGARTDCNGDTWFGDTGYELPSANGTCNLGGGGDLCVIGGVDALFGCDDASTQDLFQCERFANTPSHPPLHYSHNVTGGSYLVNLYFANTFTGTDGPGERVFDIRLEGVTVHDDFDQVIAAPGSGTAVVRSAIVTVVDGVLDISFNAEAENAALKAIEILAGPPLATTTTSTTTTTGSGATTTTVPVTTTTLPTDSDNDGIVDVADPCPADARNLCYGPVAVDRTTATALRINANSSGAGCAGSRTDCSGNLWSADYGFDTPSANGTCNLGGGGDLCVLAGVDTLFGCDDASTQDLFQCERFANTPTHPPLHYAYDVVNGEYVVNLFFANTFTGTATAGSRVFDLLLEGVTVHDDFDQVVTAPGSGVVVVRAATVTVLDGVLDISFNAETENAALKAIEVLASPVITTTTTTSTTTLPECTQNSDCDDLDACNGVETCTAGACQAGTSPVCDDGNVCTDDSCDALAGCVTTNNSIACDDALSCTIGDVCFEGECLGINDCPMGQACNDVTSTCEQSFTSSGTQPGLDHPLVSNQDCQSCHGDYDTGAHIEPWTTWSGSMMGQAGRDPLFWAALDVANNDLPDVGEWCLRCHAPKAWLEGRTQAPAGSADGCGLVGKIDEWDADFDGLDCSTCHRMFDNPTPPPGQPSTFLGNGDIWIDDGECGGVPCRWGPYDYPADGTPPPHNWAFSSYHESSDMCGSCHNVTSPALTLIDGGVDTGVPFPIERTYNEWFSSDFGPAGASFETCQNCHMPDATEDPAYASSFALNNQTGDMPIHQFAGGNAWIPDVLRGEYPNLDIDDNLAQTRDWAVGMLQNHSAVVEVTSPATFFPGQDLAVSVRVTNLTGHKLPTGYPEGRRMWLNVEARDGLGTLIWESGAYDPLTGVLTKDAQAKVYEVKQGIWNRNGTGECDTENLGGDALFHFVLNNCIALDNRIPPLGFSGAGDIEIAPVGHVYPETFPGSGILVNYDDTPYTIPVPPGTIGPVDVTAQLYYQTSSNDYIEFLNDQAVDNAFADDCIERTTGFPGMSRGEVLHDMWTRYDRSPPVPMATDVAIADDPCVTALDCDDASPCTDEACNAGLCEYTNNTAACDDGIACTTGDVCGAGTCAGTPDCAGTGVCNLITGLCEGARIYIPAATDASAVLRGAMTADTQFTAGADADGSLDSLIHEMIFADDTGNSLGGGSGDEVEYTVTLPQGGNWYLWARMYYPDAPASGGPNSFLASVDGGAKLKLGNNKDVYQQFHWDGDGEAETGAHAPVALGSLTAGAHQILIEKREVAGGTPPRLDVLMLTQDPLDVPADSEAADLLDLHLGASPAQLVWGQIDLGTSGPSMNITLSNSGTNPIAVTSVGFDVQSGSAEEFTATVGGTDYSGAATDVTHSVSVVVPAAGSIQVPVVFEPTVARDNEVSLTFDTDSVSRTVSLFGVGAVNPSHPFLDVVINADPVVVDYDQNGTESVFLSGSSSRTVEPGRQIAGYEWSENSTPFAATADTFQTLAVGDHTLTLTITDDDTPAKSLGESADVSVVSPDEIPGALLLYYDSGVADPATLLDAVPTSPDFGEVSSTLDAGGVGGTVGGSPFSTNVMVRMVAQIEIATADVHTFAASGGTDTRILVDGSDPGGAIILLQGTHDLEVRFAVSSLADVPLSVTMAQGGDAQAPIDAAIITHDELGLVPIINTAPAGGNESGGEPVALAGLGFFPSGQVTVHWGNTDLTEPALSITPTTISFLTPAGTGLVNVTVETPNGVSNAVQFSYDTGAPPPIAFTLEDLVTTTSPTQAAWGPDQRLYVASTNGTIKAFTFDDDYTITDTQVIAALQNSGLAEQDILGLTLDPFSTPGQVDIYLGHSDIFAKGGSCNFQGSFDYIGRVSRISGPSFDTLETVITGLPTSNHDHAVNGMAFDNNGDLLIAMGGNTNGGVVACNFGGIPESPLAGAVLKAEISKGASFNGTITYLECAQPFGCAGGAANNDQVQGDIVGVAAGVDVTIFAPGMRNSFDLVYTSLERVYNTDNGGDVNLGASSTGPASEGPDPDDLDTVNYVVEGDYYGHPNRNRGRADARQNVYYDTVAASIPATFHQALFDTTSSTNGIDEYRAQTFNGAMRGQLIIQKWNGPTRRVELSGDGSQSLGVTDLNVSLGSLDVTAGPGGVLIGADFSAGKLVLARPSDAAATGVTVYDIFPWRAPTSGGHSFVIGGSGFGTLASTSVTIDGVAATLTAVSSTRIHGVVPPRASAPAGLVNVVVSVDAESRLLPSAFQYLTAP